MPRHPPVDLDSILTKGGAPRVALLRHCIKSVTMEPVFLFLVQEFAFHPTSVAALALYDVFCAPNALARVGAERVLPPYDPRLSVSVATVRRELEQRQSAAANPEMPVRSTPLNRRLFDDVVAAIRDDRDGPLARLARRYDPQLSPFENLPGGKLNAGQRHFVDMIWVPRIRPHLVAAGFWKISAID